MQDMREELENKMSLSDVLEAIRRELQTTNGKTPDGVATVESIELELHVVLRRELRGPIHVRVAMANENSTKTHLVRLKLKPDKWPR